MSGAAARTGDLMKNKYNKQVIYENIEGEIKPKQQQNKQQEKVITADIGDLIGDERY